VYLSGLWRADKTKRIELSPKQNAFGGPAGVLAYPCQPLVHRGFFVSPMLQAAIRRHIERLQTVVELHQQFLEYIEDYGFSPELESWFLNHARHYGDDLKIIANPWMEFVTSRGGDK
jgi:hypothetical protein